MIEASKYIDEGYINYITGRHWCNDLFFSHNKLKETLSQQQQQLKHQFCIHIQDLFPIFESRSTLKLISHDDICWNPSGTVGNSRKNRQAAITYPAIVAEGVSNKTNKKYRLVDGRHRMDNMKSQGITESSFHVITQDEFYKAVRRVSVSGRPKGEVILNDTSPKPFLSQLHPNLFNPNRSK